MMLRLALRRLLPLLAVLSLTLAPATAPAAAWSMATSMIPAAEHHQAVTRSDADVASDTSMDDMPCCPLDNSVPPDCRKGCPLTALCLVKVTSALPVAAALLVRFAIPSPMAWGTDAAFVSVPPSPPPEPPRS